MEFYKQNDDDLPLQQIVSILQTNLHKFPSLTSSLSSSQNFIMPIPVTAAQKMSRAPFDLCGYNATDSFIRPKILDGDCSATNNYHDSVLHNVIVDKCDVMPCTALAFATNFKMFCLVNTTSQ